MTRSSLSVQSRLTFWGFATFAPVWLVVFVAAAAALVRYGNYEQIFGWNAAPTARGLVVRLVDAGGPADGRLHAGDVITGISDGAIVPVGYFRHAAPSNAPYRVRLGGSSEGERELWARVAYTGRRAHALAIFVSGVAFGAVGIFLGLARPELPAARLFALAFVCVGFLQLESALDSVSSQLPGAAPILYGVLPLFAGISNALACHAATRFPGPTVPRWMWPTLGVVVYGLAIATVLTWSIPAAALWWSTPATAANLLFQWSPWVSSGIARTLTELASGICLITILGWKLSNVKDPEGRRRLQWVMWGCIASLTPFAFYKIVASVAVFGDPAALKDSPLRTIGNGALTIAPLALAYAVATRRALDVNVVLRRGLHYALARNALTAVLLLPAAALAYAIVANQNRTIRETLFQNPAYLALMVVAVLALRFRGALRQRLDRLFFREAYDRERILRALLEDIDRCDSVADVAAHVNDMLTHALHPEPVYVWIHAPEQHAFTLVHASDVSGATDPISGDSSVIAACRGYAGAHERDERRESASDRERLDQLGVELIVPIADTAGEMIGVLMLGPMKSQEPYSPADKALLESIAKQVGMFAENLRLKEKVHEERRLRHQVVERLDAMSINIVKECPRCGACYDATDVRCAEDGVELIMSMPVDRTIDRQYRLDRVIGRGGMGVVFEAEDVRLERRVAVKIVRGAAFGNAATLRRFEREARTCARLNHPNVVSIFDYGTLQGEGAYLVMERLHGVTLRNELDRVGRIDRDDIAAMFRQIFDAIEIAHQNGIVHRDLKPENVFIVHDGSRERHIKLLDFGLAQWLVADLGPTMTVTATGQLLGTLAYMAPEQLMGAAVDERADLYAIGVMLVEALTGRRPFERASYAQALAGAHSEEFHLRGDSREARALDAALQRALAPDPQQRFLSVSDLREHLLPALIAYDRS